MAFLSHDPITDANRHLHAQDRDSARAEAWAEQLKKWSYTVLDRWTDPDALDALAVELDGIVGQGVAWACVGDLSDAVRAGTARPEDAVSVARIIEDIPQPEDDE